MPKGEAQRLQYKPGQERPGRPVVPEGEYDATIKSIGKKGAKGWKTKPGKFPNRMVLLEVHGAEGPDGENLDAAVFMQPNPKTFFNVFDFAAAFQYDGEIDVVAPKGPKDMANIKAVCEEIDKMLEACEEAGNTARISISHEEYKGRTTARVSFLAPESGEVTESEEESEETEDEEAEESEETEESEDESDTEETDEAEEDEDAEDDESEEEPEEEEEKPAKKPAKKPASKPGKTPAKKGGKK